jgi:hypothetical protein
MTSANGNSIIFQVQPWRPSKHDQTSLRFVVLLAGLKAASETGEGKLQSIAFFVMFCVPHCDIVGAGATCHCHLCNVASEASRNSCSRRFLLLRPQTHRTGIEMSINKPERAAAALSSRCCWFRFRVKNFLRFFKK